MTNLSDLLDRANALRENYFIHDCRDPEGNQAFSLRANLAKLISSIIVASAGTGRIEIIGLDDKHCHIWKERLLERAMLAGALSQDAFAALLRAGAALLADYTVANADAYARAFREVAEELFRSLTIESNDALNAYYCPDYCPDYCATKAGLYQAVNGRYAPRPAEPQQPGKERCDWAEKLESMGTIECYESDDGKLSAYLISYRGVCFAVRDGLESTYDRGCGWLLRAVCDAMRFPEEEDIGDWDTPQDASIRHEAAKRSCRLVARGSVGGPLTLYPEDMYGISGQLFGVRDT